LFSAKMVDFWQMAFVYNLCEFDVKQDLLIFTPQVSGKLFVI